jgi:hypothetical protein
MIFPRTEGKGTKREEGHLFRFEHKRTKKSMGTSGVVSGGEWERKKGAQRSEFRYFPTSLTCCALVSRSAK